jgi:hypothetical protein
MGEKLRYLDVIGKYARKATSVIDINAVRHEILREMKKERDDLEELKGHGDWDAHKRYYRTLESVQRKLEKRLKALASDSRSITQGIIRANSSKEPAKEQKELSLNSILEKYFKSSEEKGDMHSTSLFYFLDFLEKKHDGKSLTMLRFWAATEKYKRLVWRIGVGLLNEPSNLYNEEKVEEFTSATHSRLQKEVAKIYETFITNQTLLKLSPQVLDAYQRYIQPLTTPDSKYYADDYLCVFKTQKRLQEELEQVFEGFLHSNSFFQWSSETQKSKIIQDIPLLNQSDAFIVGDEDWVDVFEESALMNSLEDALFDACGRVTGIRQKPERDQFGSTEALSFLNSIITLEDIVIDREVSKDELDYDQSSPTKDDDDGDMHAPGELVTHSSKLAQINQSMDRVLHQIDCLNLLSRKVNRSKSDTDHLYIMQSHIIEEAKDYLGQEIGDLSKQKAKLESQEQREALMPGQCFVTIQELDDAEEEGVGKKVTFYLITVVEQRKLTSGWTVKRRYSDFDALHQKLREEFEMVNDFELPSKTLGLGILSRSKAEMKAIRLKALEKYLQVQNIDLAVDR